MAEDRLKRVARPRPAPIVEVVRCPTCGEVVDPSMALRAGRTAYLLCWNGHRFSLDGHPIEVGCAPVADPSVVLSERASSEAGAG